MKKTISSKNFILVTLMAALLSALTLLVWFGPKGTYSDSERRALAKFPELTGESVWKGEFMPAFETYSLDHFPFRDSFRSLKAVTSLGIFRNKANNNIYLADGYLSKLEYPLNEEMITYAVNKLHTVYETYLKPQGSKAYLAVVPDKNYFLAEENGYPRMDYERLFARMEAELPELTYVDLTSYLTLEDYYKTDTHWRQEKLTEVAAALGEAMGNDVRTEYETKKLEAPFYGVYYGQSSLPLAPETIYYLTNDALENVTVTSLETGMPVEEPLYNFEKAEGKDAYEFFLSGARALQIIENPKAETDKELIVFRDSFGSSLIPLLIEGYAKITVIDIRYVNSSFLGQLVDFHGQDTLFLYSSLILNSSMSLR